jgi:hypothetical protein
MFDLGSEEGRRELDEERKRTTSERTQESNLPGFKTKKRANAQSRSSSTGSSSSSSKRLKEDNPPGKKQEKAMSILDWCQKPNKGNISHD